MVVDSVFAFGGNVGEDSLKRADAGMVPFQEDICSRLRWGSATNEPEQKTLRATISKSAWLGTTAAGEQPRVSTVSRDFGVGASDHSRGGRGREKQRLSEEGKIRPMPMVPGWRGALGARFGRYEWIRINADATAPIQARAQLRERCWASIQRYSQRRSGAHHSKDISGAHHFDEPIVDGDRDRVCFSQRLCFDRSWSCDEMNFIRSTIF
jgi:hypothetical protein